MGKNDSGMANFASLRKSFKKSKHLFNWRAQLGEHEFMQSVESKFPYFKKN